MTPASRMNRRQFLKTALVAAGGISLAGCGLLRWLQNTSNQSGNYYVDESESILAEIDKVLVDMQQAIGERYDSAEAQLLTPLVRNDTLQLLPGLPYIGGGDNDMTANLYLTTACLALYRNMTKRGKTLDEAGAILYRTVELQVADMPAAKLMGQLTSSSLAQSKLRQEALQSQKRTYAGDWVFDFVEGNGVDFDYGVDYTECGICKYLKAQGAFELTPYLCLLDFPYSAVMDNGLVRTTTLGHGGERCDFRYKLGRPRRPEWVPPFLQGRQV